MQGSRSSSNLRGSPSRLQISRPGDLRPLLETLHSRGLAGVVSAVVQSGLGVGMYLVQEISPGGLVVQCVDETVVPDAAPVLPLHGQLEVRTLELEFSVDEDVEVELWRLEEERQRELSKATA